MNALCKKIPPMVETPKAVQTKSFSNNSSDNNITKKLYDWQRILNHLLTSGSTLSIDLEREYGIRYAPSVIQRIERHGIQIISINEPYRRKDGKTSQLARYSIAECSRDRAKTLLSEG